MDVRGYGVGEVSAWASRRGSGGRPGTTGVARLVAVVLGVTVAGVAVAGAGSAGVAVAGAATAGTPAGARAPLPDACRATTLYAVAGHGGGSAAALRSVTEPLAARSGAALSVVTVPPPPADVSYAAAETRAVGALARVVADHVTVCPRGTVMLFGHSVGAHVAGDLASRVGTGQEPGIPAERVSAVGLLGDPARAPDDRTVPDDVAGQGVLPPRPAGLGDLDARTIAICAPGDPVCDSSPPGVTMETAFAAPVHARYADLAVAPGVPMGRWATSSLARLVDAAAAAGRAPAPDPSASDPTTPSTAATGTFVPRPSAPRPATSRPSTTSAAPGGTGRSTGATWAMSGGLDGFKSTPWNNEGATEPSNAPSPNVDGREAVKFVMPGGGKRTEAEPDVRNFQDGDTAYVGYAGYLDAGFPVDTDAWQLIMQFKQPGPGSPPLAVEVGRGQLRLVNNGGNQEDFCPVTAGAPFSFQLRITFGGTVDAWCGGRPTLTGYRTPEPNVKGSAYLKTGTYRDEGIGEDGTLYLNDLKIGDTAASVSGLAGGPDGPGTAAGPATNPTG